MTRQVLLVNMGAAAAALPNTTPVVPVTGSWAPAVYTPPVRPGPELVIDETGYVTVNCEYSDFHLLLTADVVGFLFINVGEGASDADVVTINVEQTGAFTVAMGPKCVPITGTPYAVSAATGAIDVLGLKTFDAGTTWLYTVQQPAAGAVSVTLAPSPASDTDANDGSTPSAPSVQVTATPSGGALPITHAWTRVDAGGTNFLIDDATSDAPTFSISEGVTAFSATQVWRDTVTDGIGNTAQASVEVSLVRTAPLPPTGTWDGVGAEAFSARPYGIAQARMWLRFNADGTWEVHSFGSPAGEQDVASGFWGVGVVAAEYEVKYTSTEAPYRNDAAGYVPLSSSPYFEVRVYGGDEGIPVTKTGTVTVELRRIDTPGSVTTGDITFYIEAMWL